MTIFQTSAFYSVIGASSELLPFNIKVKSMSNEVFINGFITKEENYFKNLFTRRAIIIGNPNGSYINNELLELLLFNTIKNLSGRAIYIEIRNLSNQSQFINTYKKSGFEYEDHLNIIVDLSKNKEQLWKEINSKRRNEIRRAKKEGTEFEVKNDLHSLKECYDILKEVYSRAKLPLFKFDFFENLYKYLQRDAILHIFTAIYKNEIIGCMLALGYKGVLYDYYAGAKREYYSKHPNDLLPWEVFKWGKQNGYHTFDFGGAGKPGVPYKVRDYKKQFGGTFVNYGRFKCILNKPLYRIGEMGVKLMKKL